MQNEEKMPFKKINHNNLKTHLSIVLLKPFLYFCTD